MTFLAQNDKNAFAWPTHYPLMSVHGFAYMKKVLEDPEHPGSKGLTKLQRQKLNEAMALLDTLDTSEHYVRLLKNDGPNSKSYLDWRKQVAWHIKSESCLQVMALTAFSNSSDVLSHANQNNGLTMATFEATVREHVKLAPYAGVLKMFGDVCQVGVDTGSLKSVKRVTQGLEDKSITLKTVDLAESMGETEAYVVYLPDLGQGGYMNAKGWSGPLSNARMFETEKAAQASARAQRVVSAVFVRVKTQIEEITNQVGEVSYDNTQYLRDAMNRMDRKSIQNALEHATVEELKARLAQYEDVPEAPKPAKKRL